MAVLLTSYFDAMASIAGAVFFFKLAVIVCAVYKKRFFLLCESPGLFGWAAYIQKTALKFLARRHQAAGSNHHIVFNDGAIHDDGADAYQNTTTDGAAMQDSTMTDCDIIT